MPIPLTRSDTSSILTITTKTVTEPKESQKLFTYPVRHVARQTIPRRKATAANRPPPRERRQNQVQQRANQNDPNETIQAAARNLN